MRASVLLALAIGLLSAVDNPQQDSKQDLQKLTGTWRLVAGEQDGQPLPEQTLNTGRLTIAGNKHTVKVGDDTLVGTHTLDPGQKPKAIDTTDTAGPFKGKTLLGIYELKGEDELRVCFALPGKDRPKEFTTRSGTGHLLHVWKRLQE